MKNFISIVLIGILFFFTACSNDTSPKQDGLNKEILLEKSEEMRQLSLTLQSTILQVFITDANTTDTFIKSTNSMMDSAEKLAKNFSDKLELFYSITESFTQKFTLDSEYANFLSSNVNYDATTPYIAFSTLNYSKSYLFISSSTPLFLNKQSVKTLFKTPDELLTAWQRAIEFSQDRNLFLSVYEIKENGSMIPLGSTLMLSKDQVDLLKM